MSRERRHSDPDGVRVHRRLEPGLLAPPALTEIAPLRRGFFCAYKKVSKANYMKAKKPPAEAGG